MKTKKIFTIAISLLLASNLFGNNVKVRNASLKNQDLNNQTYVIEFDISWENSWRTDTATLTPDWWDAVWVFAKYKVGDNGVWKHVKLDNTIANHAITTNNGVAGIIQPSSDSLGVFMYREAGGSGSINWDDVNLLWDYSSDTTIGHDYVQVKVFALEMVYIPEGPFYVGDGAETASNPFGLFMRLYKVGNGSNKSTPYQITGEASITLGGTAPINLNSVKSTNPSGYNDSPLDDFSDTLEQTLPATYPKGYNAYYMMKHELSQQAWVDFLNTLTRTQQNERTLTDLTGTTITKRYVMTKSVGVLWQTHDYGAPIGVKSENKRNGVACAQNVNATEPITFYCDQNENQIPDEADDGMALPANFLEGPYGSAAYLDWAGLRPFTELEYVKAARGPLYPVVNEMAWGQDLFTRIGSINNADYETEENNTTNANTNLRPYTGSASDTIFRPIRVGIFATSSSDRNEAGASYYGVMDLSGNMGEFAVSIGNISGREFNGSHGDGYLSATGNANEATWFMNGIGFRNYGYSNYYAFNRVSNRYGAARFYEYRGENFGCRGARTAP